MNNDQNNPESVNPYFKFKNPYKPMTIIFALITCCLIGLVIWLFMDNSNKFKQIADLQGFIATLKGSTENGNGNEVAPNNDPLSNDSTPNGKSQNYVELPKLGIKIPLTADIIDLIEIVDVENSDSYRIDVKSIKKYREQGYCGNGGSSSVGIIQKGSVQIKNDAPGGDTGLIKSKSKWSSNTIAKFENNVVYPNEYITFDNLDAVCYDLGDGGKERGEKVAEEVQKINDALEYALLQAKPIE